MKKKVKSIREQVKNLNHWEAWMINNQVVEDNSFTKYDHICELAVQNYNLTDKRRHVEFKDELHYFLIWWNENKMFMRKYKSKYAVAGLLKKDHATVIHYVGTKDREGTRKPSNNFEENVKCIKDFLES